MAWIEVHENLREHHKVYALADALKIPEYSAIGLLVSLWTWALSQAPDGDLTAFPSRAIANAIKWHGRPQHLVDALKECHWIDEEEGRLCIHDWVIYAGRLIEKRCANAARMRSARAKNVQRTCDERAGATVPNRNLTIEEYEEEEEETRARAAPPLDLVKIWRTSLGNINPAQKDWLSRLVTYHPAEVIEVAISESALKQPMDPCAYILTCLGDWAARGWTTKDEVYMGLAERNLRKLGG